MVQRLINRPHAGRPKRKAQASVQEKARDKCKQATRAHEAYELCRELFLQCPSQEMME